MARYRMSGGTIGAPTLLVQLAIYDPCGDGRPLSVCGEPMQLNDRSAKILREAIRIYNERVCERPDIHFVVGVHVLGYSLSGRRQADPRCGS